MTILQKRAIRLLPKNKFNIAKSMREAGYSKASSYTGPTRQPILNATKEFFNEETVRRDIKRAKRLCWKLKDMTNYIRLCELESRILGIQTDKHEFSGKITFANEETDELSSLRRDLALSQG